jgi:hypothetical protein
MRHTVNRRLEILAAFASGLIHAHLDDYPGAAMQSRYVSNTSRDHVLVFTLLATLRTGVMLRFDRLALNIIVLTADYRNISHEGSSR